MDWQTALEQMSQSQLHELLYSLAAENETLQNRIVRMVSGPGDAPAQWQDDLDQIISDYGVCIPAETSYTIRAVDPYVRSAAGERETSHWEDGALPFRGTVF